MMADCQEFLESYSDFRDGLLTTIRMEGFESHLRNCASCARYDRVVGGGVQVFRSLPELSPSPDFQARLRDQLRFVDLQSARHASGASVGVTLLICFAIGFSAWIPTLRPEQGPTVLPPMVAHAPYHDLTPMFMRGVPLQTPPSGVSVFANQPAFYGQGLLLEQSTSLPTLAFRPTNAFYIRR